MPAPALETVAQFRPAGTGLAVDCKAFVMAAGETSLPRSLACWIYNAAVPCKGTKGTQLETISALNWH